MLLQPNYYDYFECIADKCKDNCCIGWEIDIDNDTYEEYAKIGGTLGDRLKKSIKTVDGVHSFKLDKNERCPFLNSNNLCDIICELGKEKLCHICKHHPRYINNYEGITEIGLGLACEEACRIILNQQSPTYIIDSDTKQKFILEGSNSKTLTYLYKARDIIISLLQNRNYNIQQRLYATVALCEYIHNDWFSDKSDDELIMSLGKLEKETEIIFNSIDKNTDNCITDDKNKLVSLIISDYTKLEVLDNKWIALINNTLSYIDNNNCLLDFNFNHSDLIFENILVYFMHRYFIENCLNDCIIENAFYMLSEYVLIKSLYAYCQNIGNNYTIEDIVHSYSKEIEYSDKNMEDLLEVFHYNIAYNKENICSLIL